MPDLDIPALRSLATLEGASEWSLALDAEGNGLVRMGDYWDDRLGGDCATETLAVEGGELTHVSVDVATFRALLDAAEAMGLGSRAVVDRLQEQRAETDRLATSLDVLTAERNRLAEAPTAKAWKRARLERDALRRDRDRLHALAVGAFLATYTLHTDITRGLAAALTASGGETDG